MAANILDKLILRFNIIYIINSIFSLIFWQNYINSFLVEYYPQRRLIIDLKLAKFLSNNKTVFNAVIIIIMTGFVGAMRHRSQRRQETAGRTVAVSVKVNRPERVLAKRRQELRNVKSEWVQRRGSHTFRGHGHGFNDLRLPSEPNPFLRSAFNPLYQSLADDCFARYCIGYSYIVHSMNALMSAYWGRVGIN